MNKRPFYVLFFLCSVLASLQAQYHTTHYNMLKLPRVQINPALPLPNKTEVDLFGFGLDLNLPFSYKNVVQGSGSNKVIDVNKFVNSLSKTNVFSNRITAILPGVYLRFNKLSVHFYNQVRVQNLFSFDRGALELLSQGNTNSTFFGKSAQLNVGLRTNIYAVTGLGGAYQINDKLRVGATIKIYNGLADLRTTKNTSLSLTTSQERNFPLKVSAEGGVESSGILKPSTKTGEIQLEDIELYDEATEFLNSIKPGFGIDLGATYKLNEKLILEFALTDLNLMTWSKNVQGYNFVAEETSFDGVDITDGIRDNNLDFDVNLDTLGKGLKLSNSNLSKYRGGITPAVLSIGANYVLPYKITVGGIFRGRSLLNTVDYSFSLYAHKSLGVIGFGLNYAAEKNNFGNVGLGLTFGPFYIMTDNILAALAPLSAKQLSTQFGFRIPAGNRKRTKKSKKDDKSDVDDYGKPTTKPIDLNIDNYKPKRKKQSDLDVDSIKRKKHKKDK